MNTELKRIEEEASIEARLLQAAGELVDLYGYTLEDLIGILEATELGGTS